MIKAFVEGAVGAVCFLYAMQTRIMYPEFALQSFDHPWVILLAIVACILIWPWSPKICLMSVLCICAFIADVHIFSAASTHKTNIVVPEHNNVNDYMLLN